MIQKMLYYIIQHNSSDRTGCWSVGPSIAEAVFMLGPGAVLYYGVEKLMI